MGALDRGYGGPTPGRSRLYENPSMPPFADVTHRAGTRGAGHSLYAKFYDLDLDGWLDLYVGEFYGTNNLLYRNNTDKSFTEIGASVGVDVGSSTHAVAIADFNDDGLPDIVVGNDFTVHELTGMPNSGGDALLIGQPDGTWSDESAEAGMDQTAAVMGFAVGDVDANGLLDVYKTDIGLNYLMTNHGWPESGLAWEDSTHFYEVGNAEVEDHVGGANSNKAVGWAAMFFDADLDTWADLFVVNGHLPATSGPISGPPLLQQNFLFRSLGPDGSFVFEDATAALGLLDHHDDQGAAIGDVDADGDPDLFVAPTTGALRFYEHLGVASGRKGLTVAVRTGTSGADGIGTVVRRTDPGGTVHLRSLGAEAPSASNNALEVHFGLGHEERTVLTASFPSGMTKTTAAVAAGGRVTLSEPRLFALSETVVDAAPAGKGAGAPAEVLVAVFAHDSFGVPLDALATVSIEVPGLTPSGPVQHLAANRFARSFAVPAAPGRYRVEATFDGWTPAIRPSLFVRGAVDESLTRVVVSPEAVRLDDPQGVVITATPRDALGVNLGPGHTVLATVGADDPLPMTDVGDGTYVAALEPTPAFAASYGVSLEVDGVDLGALGQVEVAAAPHPSKTTVYGEVPEPQHQAGAEQLRLVVTPKDSFGFRTGPRTELELTLLLDAGSSAAFVRDDLLVGQDDGEFICIVEKPKEDLFVLDASGTVEIRADGILVFSGPFSF